MVKHNHVLHFNIMEVDGGHVIGQCLEIPSILVQAKEEKELQKLMSTAIAGYFDAFPEAHDKLLLESKTHEILVEA